MPGSQSEEFNFPVSHALELAKLKLNFPESSGNRTISTPKMKIVVSKTKNFLKNDHSHTIFFEIKSKFLKKHEKDRYLPVHLLLENTLKL